MHCGLSWVSMKCKLLRDTQSVESQGGKGCVTETEDCLTAGTEDTNDREPSAETEIGAEDRVRELEDYMKDDEIVLQDLMTVRQTLKAVVQNVMAA